MKNRKKQFLKIGGIVAVFAVVGIVAGVMQYKKDHRFDLTVAEHTIPDCYSNVSKSYICNRKLYL